MTSRFYALYMRDLETLAVQKIEGHRTIGGAYKALDPSIRRELVCITTSFCEKQIGDFARKLAEQYELTAVMYLSPTGEVEIAHTAIASDEIFQKLVEMADQVFDAIIRPE